MIDKMNLDLLDEPEVKHAVICKVVEALKLIDPDDLAKELSTRLAHTLADDIREQHVDAWYDETNVLLYKVFENVGKHIENIYER